VHLGDGGGGQWLVLDEAKTSESGRPSSSVRTCSTTGHGSGLTWSRHHLNSATSSGGKMPSPEATIWPSLM
jgi:hypothetical protein